MFLKFIKNFVLATIGISLTFGVAFLFGYIFLEHYFRNFINSDQALLITVFIFCFAVTYFAFFLAVEDVSKEVEKAKSKQKSAEKASELWKISLREKCSGFPSLLNAIQEYEKLKDSKVSDYLKYKKHPAKKAADIVKNEAKRRREAEFKYNRTLAIIEYYESIAPFLLDFKEEIIDDDREEDFFKEYNAKERQDPATNYLAKDEYRKLSKSKRNQLALDRFWQRPKSKWLIGKLYERYVGFLFENDGYDVEYFGIFKGYEDLGRDLICSKGNEIIIVQCKNWSQFKTIYENHIFQFFGTVFQYKDSNPEKIVKGMFFSTTQVSDLARRFSDELGIKLVENHVFDQSYPCIKCNVNPSTKERIYHLPFDQQYDKTKINRSDEFYAQTVKEAEAKGFRRAFRWKGEAKG